MGSTEMYIDKEITNHMGQKWNVICEDWNDGQTSEYYEKCFLPLVGKVEEMGKHTRDLIRIIDDNRREIDEIMGL